MNSDKLAALLALAEKASPWRGQMHFSQSGMDVRYIAHCSPEVVAALVKVAIAADAIFNGHHGEDESTLIDPLRALDAALTGGEHD
jgi:hypothetical protein